MIVIHPILYPGGLKVKSSPFYIRGLSLSFLHSELDDFVALLDQRYDAKVKKDGITMAKKVRKLGLPSKSYPPTGAPDWTVDKDWKG